MDKIQTSPAQVYQKIRLERARKLLVQARGAMTVVALATGFQNVSHCGRIFPRVFGQSLGKAPRGTGFLRLRAGCYSSDRTSKDAAILKKILTSILCLHNVF